MESKKQYYMVPLDEETKLMLVALCEAYEMGKRGQGAMVRKLVKPKFEELLAAKLVKPLPRKMDIVKL